MIRCRRRHFLIATLRFSSPLSLDFLFFRRFRFTRQSLPAFFACYTIISMPSLMLSLFLYADAYDASVRDILMLR